MGGEDPLRGTRDDIIRSLPDLKAVITKPQSTVTLDEEQQPAAVEVNPANPFTGGQDQAQPQGAVPPINDIPKVPVPGVDAPPPPPPPANMKRGFV